VGADLHGDRLRRHADLPGQRGGAGRCVCHRRAGPDGSKVYNLATGLSLLVFYVLAMQCMSTLAVVKRETRSWKWPVIQLFYMTGLAYVMSLLVYNLFG
ncbi:MAG: hypothetical protein ABJA71_05705, partial [Ginsengibacter sp.]